MNQIQCDKVEDCNLANATAAMVCFTDGICRCSSSYGFSGEDCREITTKLIFNRVFNIIFIIFSVILILLHIHLIFKLLISKKKKGKVVIRFWALVILSFIYSIIALVANSLRTIGYYNSSLHKLISFIEFGIKTEIVVTEYDFFAYKLWITESCLGTLIVNMIVLSWFSIIKKVIEVFPEVITKRERYLAKFLTFYTPFFLLLLLITLAINEETLLLSAFVLIINTIIVVFMYIWLTLYVLKPIKQCIPKENLNKTSSLGKSVGLISFSLRMIIFFGITNVIGASLGIFVLQVYPSNPSEGLGTLVALVDVYVGFVCVLFSCFSFWYIFTISSKNYQVRRKSSAVLVLTQNT